MKTQFKFLKLKLSFTALILGISLYSSAQTDSLDLYELNLEALMNMQVVTASKQMQSIEKAPAIIDVISEQQIQDFNANNLYEIISLLPGIEMMETFFGRTVLNFRGVTNINYTNKVLLMIDGNPIYDVVTGSYYLEAIPTNSISRIEIIRGPGSSLYGTNAYSGVINVITKSAEGPNSVSARLSWGEFNTQNMDLASRIKFNEKTGVYINGEILNNDGYNFHVNADEKGKSGNIDYTEKISRFLSSFYHDNFHLTVGAMGQLKSLYGVTPNLAYTGMQERYIYWGNAKYQYKIPNITELTLMARYNYLQSPSISVGAFPIPNPEHPGAIVELEQSGNATGAELQANTDIIENLSNISGVVYEQFQTDPYLWLYSDNKSQSPFTAYKESHTSSNIAGYTQFSYTPITLINVVAGARIVKNSELDNIEILPRAGLVTSISDKYFIKLLYGQAFRSASFFEKYVATKNVLFGDEKLKPEKIQTIDLGFEANINKYFKGRINGYLANTSDGIERIPSPDTAHGVGAAIYVNTSKYQYYGLEIAASGLISNKGYYGANFSYKNGINSDTDKELYGFTPLTGNLWIQTQFFNFFIFNPSLQWIGEREGFSSRAIAPGDTVQNYKLDNYLLANLIIGAKISKVTCKVGCKNILDAKYSYPEYIRGRTEEVPGGPRRHFFISFSYNFDVFKGKLKDYIELNN